MGALVGHVPVAQLEMIRSDMTRWVFGWPSSLTTYLNNTPRFCHSNQWSTYRKIPRVWALGFTYRADYVYTNICFFEKLLMVQKSRSQPPFGCRKPCNSWVNWWVFTPDFWLPSTVGKTSRLPRQTQIWGMCNLSPPKKAPPMSSPSKGGALSWILKVWPSVLTCCWWQPEIRRENSPVFWSW